MGFSRRFKLALCTYGLLNKDIAKHPSMVHLYLNQSPKGIMRSAVSLPCFFEVTELQKVVGQRPQQGTKSCRMGRNSVRPYVHLSICPLSIQRV